MILVVLDTNVLASGITHSGGPAGRVITAWRQHRFRLVTSEHILEELRRTLEKRYFRSRLTKRERKSLMARLRRQSQVVTITATVEGVAPHLEDDLVLATALSAEANFLVTKDDGLLAVGEHGGVHILRPERLLDVL